MFLAPSCPCADVPRINTATAGRKGKDSRGKRGNDGTTALRGCADSSSDCIVSHRGHATIRLRQTQIHHNRSSHNRSNSSSANSSNSSSSRQRHPPHPRGGSLRGSAARGAAKTLRGNGRGGGGDQGQLPPPYDSSGNRGATTATAAPREDLRRRTSVATSTYRQDGYDRRRQVLDNFAYPQYPPYAPDLPGGPPQSESPLSAPPPLEPPPSAPLPVSIAPASQSAPTWPPVRESSPPLLLPAPPPPPPAPPPRAPPYPVNPSPRPPGALVPQAPLLEHVPPPPVTPAYASQVTTESVAPAAAGPSSGSAEPNGTTGRLSSVLPPPPSQKLSTVASRNEPPLPDSSTLPSPLPPPLSPPPYYLTVHRRGTAKFDAILAATAGAVGLVLLLMFIFVMLRIRKALRSKGHNNSAFCVPEAALIRGGGGGGGGTVPPAVVRPFKGVAFDPEGVTDAEMSPMRFIGSGPAAAVPMPTGKEMGSVIKPRSIVRGGTVTGVAGVLSSKKLGGSAGGAAATGGGVAAGVNLDMCHNLLYDMYDTDNSPDVGRRGVPPALQRHLAAQSSGGFGRNTHGGGIGGGGGGAVHVPVGHETERVVRRLTADMSLPSPHGYSAAARTVASRNHGSGGEKGPMGQCSGDTTARRGSLDQNSVSPDDQNTKGRGATAPTTAKSHNSVIAAAAAAQTSRRTTDDDDAYAVLVVGRHRRDLSLAKVAGGRGLHSNDSDGEHRPPLGDGRGRDLTPRSSIDATSDVDAAVHFTTTRRDIVRHTGNTHRSGIGDHGRRLDSCNGGSGGGGGSAATRARVRPSGLSEGGAVAGGRTAAAPRAPARGATSYSGVPPVGGGGAAAVAIAPAVLRLKRPPRTSSGGSGSCLSNGGMATARSVSQPASSSASLQQPPLTAASAVRGGVSVPRHMLGSAAPAVSAPTAAASSSPAASAAVPTARRRYHTDGNGDISGSDADDIATTANDTRASEDDNEGDGDDDCNTSRASEVASASLLRRLLVQKSGGLFVRQILDAAPETAAAVVAVASMPSPRATFADRPTGRSISLLAAAAAAASNDGGCGRKPGGGELNAATLGPVSNNEISPRISSAGEKPALQRHRLSQSSGGNEPKDHAVLVVDVKKAKAPTVHAGLRSGKVTASGGKKDGEGEGDGISSNDSNEIAVDVEAVQQPLASARHCDQYLLSGPPPQQQQRFRRPPPR
ncbi:hypothetical protein Vafri_13884 [Volvox africanus]|uniref:Uncharacterized protein n=1 Tax=Volvox africanus TaxID=51714 RepID=A0A8J4BI30_9CHLO|nr:hypothetical protein Vafri_13884 [Volvox africanus]